ncbi:Crocetin glucosyltransferase 3 [Acorus gramineus]|uniref:Glycosyltransferase n=1 Tax=Acorus gramineus TaxID=55184 RepID=A0AAV9APD8_ACOGR|nr:Crocetin glucosyltransferase 3 [Acorus gramineus]
MAEGHLIPFMQLAHLISHRQGYTVTIVNTPSNILTLRSLLPSTSTTIHLSSLPFNPSDHNLPPNSESTHTLPSPTHILALIHSSESLRPHFIRLLSDISSSDGRPPLSIIADVFVAWTVEVARDLGIHHAVFTTCGGCGTAAYFSLWLHFPHLKTTDSSFGVPGFPDGFRLDRSQISGVLKASRGADDEWSSSFRRHMCLSMESDAMLCNTVEEVEALGVKALREVSGLPVWAVGPLLRGPKPVSSLNHDSRACMEWMDLRARGSVVYVSFGSQNRVTASQMRELALGLETSGRDFVWVVRAPVGFDPEEEFRAEEWLPEGFEERMKNRGVVIRGWAPQVEILSHASVGAFLSHCGWNSVLESLSNGVPVIGWPMGADQYYNAKVMVEELGVCVELKRGLEGEIDGGDVARVVGVVMDSGGMKRRAVEVGVKMRAAMGSGEGGERRGSSLEACEDFFDEVEAFYNRYVGVG